LAIRHAPLRRAFSTWTMPLYIAAMGQIGIQLLLPQQGGRPSYGTLFCPTGSGTTLKPLPFSISAKRRSLYDGGMASIG
jgi:hypothetical protein